LKQRIVVALIALYLISGFHAFRLQAQSSAIPEGFSLPAGFSVDEKLSKTYDFNHEPISYPKGGSTQQIDPSGKTWAVFLRVTPPNRTSNATDAAMRPTLKAQGWDLLTPSGALIAHRVIGGKEQWFKGFAESGDFRATIIEVGPAPHALTLPPPAAVPETIADGDDFPYLLKFPGSTLKRTQRTDRSVNVAPPGVGEQLAGPPTVEKLYDLPASVSKYEYMVIYRDALLKAGWDVVRTFASSDALVVAHYTKNGRDIFCYLHDGTFSVADVGTANETKRLAEALAAEGHIAIYGIYFDVDKSQLRPDSETALQHILALLKADAKLNLEVQGHTDNSGTPAHNLTLSNDRAASVKKWLLEHGIANARLTPKGYGDSQPVADNKTPEGRAKNRRVELTKM
jgi:OOP family OmpA-OmpF porin